MSVECMLQILENLEYRDLLAMSRTNHYFGILARDVFRRKLSSKTIEIVAPFTKGIQHPIYETSSSIMLENLQLVRLSLRIFGAEIKKIQLRFYSLDPEQRREIHHLINKYCSDSLTSLILNKCDEDTLAYFAIPLEKVESITIDGELKSVSEGLKFNEIFPALRRLSMNDVNIDSEVLNIEFQHLTHFTLTISFLNDIYKQIEVFIKRNSQIKDLTLIYCNSFDYIKLASEHLPNLERLQMNLGILGSEYTGSKIHFDSVKSLEMNWGEYDFTDILEFSQLESLELTCAGEEGTKFATQFNNLRKLELIQRELEKDDVLKLSNLSNLKELTISSLSEIQEDTIWQLINRMEKLEKFKLKLSYGDHFDALNYQFGDNWTVTMDGMEVCFKQKIES